MKVKIGCQMRCSKCGDFFKEDGSDCIVAWSENYSKKDRNINRPMVLLHAIWSKGCDNDNNKYPSWANYSHLERKVRTKWTGMSKQGLRKLCRETPEVNK